MKHTHFKISNFKGIDKLQLDFDSKPTSRVVTLVGLNESGKTTVLEAMNFFKNKPETLEPLKLPGYSIEDVHDIIPVSKRSNFSDKVTIEAGFELSSSEQTEIRALFSALNLTPESALKRFSLTAEYNFADSKFTSGSGSFIGFPNFKKKPRKTFIGLGAHKEEWVKVREWLTARFPPIVYFPNFLFNFPARIYLETAPADERQQKFYRALFEQILIATDPSFDLNTHVLARAKSKDKNDSRALQSVLTKVNGHVSMTVFNAWNNTFQKRQSNKEIQFSVDQDDDGHYFIQMHLKEGTDVFAISERSLGFRWFFSFLLLTNYLATPSSGSGSPLFLFDEPASNLHSSAQRELLNSFHRFHPNSRIVYTTHSHHLINSEWLESAYVVKNEGIDYDHSDLYTSRESKIVVEKYRKFAAEHPDQTTYYQPILDVLEYKPSNMELAHPAIFFEGKNDSYTLALAAMQDGYEMGDLSLMPGTGSGNLETVIRLYLGWGRKFVVVLDADKEGQKQKLRYLQLFGLAAERRVYTIADFDPAHAGKALEDVVPPSERLAIQTRCYPATKSINKDQYNRSLQELLLSGAIDTFSPAISIQLVLLLKGARAKIG